MQETRKLPLLFLATEKPGEWFLFVLFSISAWTDLSASKHNSRTCLCACCTPQCSLCQDMSVKWNSKTGCGNSPTAKWSSSWWRANYVELCHSRSNKQITTFSLLTIDTGKKQKVSDSLAMFSMIYSLKSLSLWKAFKAKLHLLQKT